MELSKNSVWAKLYRWFYVEKAMPETICTYFWKLLLAVLLSPVIFIFALPTNIINLFTKNIGDGYVDLFLSDTFTERFIVNVVVNVGILCILCILIALYTIPVYGMFDVSHYLYHFQFTGAVTILVGIVILLSAFGIYLNKIYDKFKNRNKNVKDKKPKVNLLKEFIKSKYNKFCTKINWK